MIIPGLTSITFRSLTAQQIIKQVSQAGLNAIEWGGDKHVPHGDTKLAAQIRRQTEEAGLELSSYGAYYRAGEAGGPDFDAVLDSAQALGVGTIRVWAGKQSSAQADENYRKTVVDDLSRIADLAAEAGLVVATEYHANTLTDTIESARQLLDEADHPGVLTYWQPPNGASRDHCLQSLESVLDKLANIHVFHWTATADGIDRRPLSEGIDPWDAYLKKASQTGRKHYALMEFVRNESTDQFAEDAATLKKLIP